MIIVNKQYIRIVDHLEKEVRIYDTINQKKIFNIFFNELDSAICLNGALTDTVDLLNDLSEENEELKSEKKDMQILINTISDQRNEFHRGVRENANRVGKLEKENEQLKQRIKELEQEVEKLDTFKKILEYAENDSDRVDWQSYCEKEFEGL